MIVQGAALDGTALTLGRLEGWLDGSILTLGALLGALDGTELRLDGALEGWLDRPAPALALG